MQNFGWIALGAIVAMLTAVPPAVAQLMRDHEKEGGVRGFHGPRPLGGIKRSFQSDAEARAEFERVASAVGLNWITDRIALRASAETPNAEAFISTKSGERFIFYNALFMQKVKQRTAEHWSLVSILAHEIGHHVALHTEIEGRYHEFELEADYFSGFVLRRLGATLDQTQTGMRLISPREASPTHPGLDQRLQVITIGWTDAGTQGPPRGLKKADETDPAAQARERERLALLQKQQEEERQRAEEKRKAEEAARREPALLVRPGSGESFRDRLADGRQCPECPEMVVVPAGSFTMGSPTRETGRDADEGPQRRVTIARPFAVGKFEVKRGELAAFERESGLSIRDRCGTYERGNWPVRTGASFRNPGFQQDDRHPAVCVSWGDATAFVGWLSSKTGKAYRLLSEAEWEYAARAGTTTRYHFGDSEQELCGYGNGADQTAMQTYKDWTVASCRDGHVNTAPAGSYRSNAFGLHDMHGNVWEWVQDCWNDNYNGAPLDGSARIAGDCNHRVQRGGSWFDNLEVLRSASRGRNFLSIRNTMSGFRIGRAF